MNPVGDLSFGKTIKSFIPGLIASLGVLILLDLSYQLAQLTEASYGAVTRPLWKCLLSHSFFHRVILGSTVVATATGAILLPMSLALGFFINTLLWLIVNRHCRRWADRWMDPAILVLRKSLETRAQGLLAPALGPPPRSMPKAISLQSFYLPALDLDKVLYLWESYFSWYEFQINSAFAVAFSSLAYAVSFCWLASRLALGFPDFLTYLGLPLILAGFASWFLVYAAIRNLVRHQESFVLYLTGALHLPTPAPAA